MSFLSGSFLFALPLVAAPVVLHFYRRRQRDVVPWGAMQFLQDAAKKGRRWERLEELLLMLLRCAAVLALVLALARPRLHGEWFGERPRREVILVLDNSLSTSREVDGQTPFEVLQERAREIINDLTDRDQLQVMLAVGGPDWQTSEAVPADEANKAELLRRIDALAPSLGAAELLSSLQAAVDAASTDDVLARHIVVLTDAQAHGWRTDAPRSWRQLRDAIGNLAVMTIEASERRIGPSQSVAVQAQIQNLGAATGGPLLLNHLVDGETFGSSEIPALAAGESATVSWDWSTSEPGVYALAGQLDVEDQLPGDDRDAVVVEVVDRIPILVVNPPPSYDRRMSEEKLFAAAIGYDGPTPHADWHAVFAPRFVSPEELASESLQDCRAVVVTSLTPLSSKTVETLRRFVESGGGLWVALGRRVDQEAFNALWYDDGGGMSPLPLAGRIAHTDDEENADTIHPPSADHIATAQLSDTNRLDVDSVRILSRNAFDRTTASEELSVLLETGDGDPLVVEQFVGRGRVIVQGVPFDVASSNLALTGAFVVMVNDWLAYLTRPAATQFNLPTGARMEWPTSLVGQAAGVTLATPAGREQRLTPRQGSDADRYVFSQTRSPGRYEVRFTDADGETREIPFQIARDAQESDLTSLSAEERAALNDVAAFVTTAEATNLIPDVTIVGSERPVWTPLLIGLMILLVLELLLATLAAQSRSPKTSMPSLAESIVPTTHSVPTNS